MSLGLSSLSREKFDCHADDAYLLFRHRINMLNFVGCESLSSFDFPTNIAN